MSQHEPPPFDYDNLEPPPDFYDEPPPEFYDEPPPPGFFDSPPFDDYDAGLDFDPYPRPDMETLPIPDDYVPDDPENLLDLPHPDQDGLQGFEEAEPLDEGWSWHDARLIGVDRGEDATENRYEVVAIDLYANADTGDLGGSYLPIASFDEEGPAVGYYHDLQRQIYDAGLPNYEVPEFAESRAFEMQPEPSNWRSAGPVEYEAYEYLRDLESFDLHQADEPPDESIDPLIETAMELGGVVEFEEPEVDDAAFQALSAIGVEAENFDPTKDPPPFYDAETGTAYWIGVFQPDKDDRENCVTSILSLGRDPETGEMEAQLAPCVPGDWDKAYGAAEYLIDVAQRGGIEQVFDTAEGMALATDQRELWEAERGVPLEKDAARDIADYTSGQWEVEL